MRHLVKVLTIALVVLFGPVLLALPLLEAPVPLPADFDGIITIYPDSNNTVQIRRYWLVPSTVRIVRNQDGNLAFGLVHSGVSSFDPDGINALLNITAQPYIDSKTLQNAKTLVEEQAKKEGATSVTFNFISPTETAARILVGGQYAKWGEQNALIVKGGIVEAGIPFQVKLDKSFDVRALTQAGGPKAALMGVEFRMKFNGQGSPCEIHLVGKFTETYTHVLAVVKASGWWGLVQGNAKYESQQLQKTPGVSLSISGCTQDQVEKYHAVTLLDALFTAVNSRTGLFAKELKPSGLPDAPGGGGIWGWSLSAGGGFETYTDTTDFKIDISVADKREQEIVYGLNFPLGGDELKDYVKNLTDTSKPYPSDADFKAQADQHKKCRTNNKAALVQYKNDGTISAVLYEQLIANALEKGCYVDYTTGGVLMKAMTTGKGKLSVSDILQFSLSK
jgi:hypothetical protein